MAPRAFSARLSTPLSPLVRACSSAVSSHRSPSSWCPTRAWAVPYSSARLADSASSLPWRAARYLTTSACCPAAVSSRALSTTSDDVCIGCVLRLPRNRVLGEVEHLRADHLLTRIVPRQQLSPGAPAALRIDREVLRDQLIGAVYDSVAVQIRIRVLIPEGQLCRGGAGEDDAGRLEVHPEVDRVYRLRDEDRVAPVERHVAGARHEAVDRDLEAQEWVARELAGNAAVIDADRRLRPPFGPERHLVGLEPRRGRGLPEHRDRAGRRRHGLGERRRDRGSGDRKSV